MGKLVLFLKDATPVEIPLDKERVTIGRRPDNDVCLPHPAVSGEHAAVVTILTDSFLEDLGSTNGTQVNGRSIVKHFLRDRDQIDIGRQLLVYLADSKARAEPPPGFLREERREIAQRVEPARREARPASAPPARAEPKIATPIGAALASPVAELDAEFPRIEPRIGSPIAPARAVPPAGDAAPAPAPVSKAVPSAPPPVPVAAHEPSQGRPRGADRAAVENPDAEFVAMRRAHVDTLSSPPDHDEARTGVAPGAVRARVRVLTGPQAGRVVPIAGDEFVLGRVGVQVAAIVAQGPGFALVSREGPPPTDAAGEPVPPNGCSILPGEAFEVAGTRLELLPAD